jgi:hypothetical protein
MTTLLDGATETVSQPPQRRRWVVAAIAAALLAVVGVATAGIIYAHHYSPLVAGAPESGPVTPQTLKAETDGTQNVNEVLVGPPGTVGTYQFTLSNTGHHAVQILGSAGGDPVTHLRTAWSRVNPRSDSLIGSPRSFPVTIQGGQAISILTTVTQPDCARSIPDRITSGGELRWQAFHVHHVLVLPGDIDGPSPPILTCPTKNVLALTHP